MLTWFVRSGPESAQRDARAHPSGELNLHSTVTHFGAPHDVNLAELAVESFFPADDETRRILGELAAGTAA